MNDKYQWPAPIILTEQQIDDIADRAAKKVFDTVAMQVGWKVLRAVSYIIGAALVALAVWLAGAGHIKP